MSPARWGWTRSQRKKVMYTFPRSFGVRMPGLKKYGTIWAPWREEAPQSAGKERAVQVAGPVPMGRTAPVPTGWSQGTLARGAVFTSFLCNYNGTQLMLLIKMR